MILAQYHFHVQIVLKAQLFEAHTLERMQSNTNVQVVDSQDQTRGVQWEEKQ